MDKEEEERLNKRLGWILCELGKEDYQIERLKELLRGHIGRRKAMEHEMKSIARKLELEGTPDEIKPDGTIVERKVSKKGSDA